MLTTISGTYNLQASFGYNLLQENEIYLQCDTSVASVIINLPLIDDFDGLLNMKIYVTDFGNNAFTNNIQIVPASGNTINSFASVIIDNNGGSASLSIASYDKWIAYDSHTTSPITTAYNTIQDEGVPLPQRTVIDFVGDSVTASDVGGETKVQIQAYNTIKDDGTIVPQRSAIDFVGGGVTVSDNGGITEVNIPTQQAYTTIEDEGNLLPQRTTLNFVGSGVTASDNGVVTEVNIPIQPAYTTIQDEGISLPQRTTLDFQGQGVTVTDNGVKTIVTVPTLPPTTNFGLFAQTSLGTAITATTTELNLIGTGVGTLTVPANTFTVGNSFAAKMCGKISSANNEGLSIRVKSNGVTIIDTGVVVLNITTNKYFDLVLDFTITKLGVAGVAELFANGLFTYNKNANTNIDGVNFALVSDTTFDTTITNTLTITAQWSSPNVGNSIQSQNFVLAKVY